MNISRDLREAYKGYYENDSFVRQEYEDEFHDSIEEGLGIPSFEYWLNSWAEYKCEADTPKRRLEIYCEWNGIIGYSSRLFAIATGEV